MDIDEFYQRHEKKLFAYLFSRIGDVEIADTILAKLFIRVWEEMANQNSHISPLPKLYKYAQQSVFEYLRGIQTDLP